MALPIHVIANAFLRAGRYQDSERFKGYEAPKDMAPSSLEGIVSDIIETISGRIYKVRPKTIDYDAPEGSGYYRYTNIYLKDELRKKHKLILPTPRSYKKSPIDVYTGKNVTISNKRLLNGKILTEHFVENYIWPFTYHKTYPVLETIKADGIIISGIDLNELDLYKF